MSQAPTYTYTLPIFINLPRRTAEWRLEDNGILWTQRIHYAQGVQDPWAVRGDFLSLRAKDNDALLEFLDKTGSFDRLGMSRFKIKIPGIWPEQIVRVEDVWEWQKVLASALKGKRWSLMEADFDPKKVEKVAKAGHWGMTINVRQHPRMTVIAQHTLPAMIATVQLDRMVKAKFRWCARKNCGKPYRVLSTHYRKFCTPECAHAEAVRRSRENARKQADSGRPGR